MTKHLPGILSGAVAVAASAGLVVAAPGTATAGVCDSSWALSIANLSGGFAGGGPDSSSARTTFWNQHFASDVPDRATAIDNFYAATSGLPARRSAYGTAPGGSVCLQGVMMKGLYYVAASYRVVVTEMAGASHSPGSAHYDGMAFDIGTVNGTPVSSLGEASIDAVSGVCRNTGAVAVYNPLNDPSGHADHIHCDWRD
jgi:hypothetical protein